MSKIRIGISACLLGKSVRYDGGHKLDHFLRDTLGQFVEFVAVCPEVELGLPTPREALRLVGDPADQRLVFSRSGEDITESMQQWAAHRVAELEKENLCGFIFKSRSPSSGMSRVKLYDGKGAPSKQGVGLFAKAFMEHFPLIPVEEDGRLHDPKLRENFIEAIFTFQRWRQLIHEGQKIPDLISFHARHKFLLASHSVELVRQMGKLVAAAGEIPAEDLFVRYQELLMRALRLNTSVAKHVNVLQHILGFFKKDLSADEKQELLEIIEQYRKEHVPLSVPITLINHYVRKYRSTYLEEQVYLHPHPVELHLRTGV